MNYVSDFHLHSKYSRAVSQMMILPEMAKWADKKGIDLLSVSDFTHPLWLREIKDKLTETNEGIFKLKIGETKARFILSTEIASIYKQGGSLRRIHNLLFAPNLEVAEKINQALMRLGCNLGSDGRPIIGLSSKQLLEVALNIDKKVILIPCHVWTPHFGLYGSKSGFNSIAECFGELSKYIYGIETGISSDPWMNWQIPELQTRSILSFSDAHSAPKMAREVTAFAIDKTPENLTYTDLGKAISEQARRGNSKIFEEPKEKVAYTIEFYPEEGKYHYSGHRACGISKSPEEIRRDGDTCPICKKSLTEGVMIRVEELAQNPEEFKSSITRIDKNGISWTEDPEGIHPPFVRLVPLNEIIAETIGSPTTSEKVRQSFDDLCNKFGSEINILLNVELSEIEKENSKLAEGIGKVRKGDIVIEPGFDGEYGIVKIWKSESVRLQKPDQIAQLGFDL